MIILISSAMIVGFIGIFFSIIACNFHCSPLCLWSNWLGWGLFITAALTICVKTTELILKEVVSVIRERLPLHYKTSRSTTRPVITSDKKRIFVWFKRYTMFKDMINEISNKGLVNIIYLNTINKTFEDHTEFINYVAEMINSNFIGDK